MVHEWKELEHKIDVEDGKDLKEVEEQSIGPEDENSPAAQRMKRIEVEFQTNVHMWDCKCAHFNLSPYHICSHVLRRFGEPYRVEGESV